MLGGIRQTGPLISPRRAAGALGVASPPLAALLVFVATASTPGYDQVALTISRLAVPGGPAALDVQLAIGLMSLSCFALAYVLPRDRSVSRWALTVAGVAGLLAAGVRLDPASVQSTVLHRLATAVAFVALVVAPLAVGRAYGLLSLITGASELVLVAVGVVLFSTTFNAWGIWERCLLALPAVWIVATSFRFMNSKRTEPISRLAVDASNWAKSVSADDTISALAASVRSGRS